MCQWSSAPNKTSSKSDDEKGRRLPRVPIANGEAAFITTIHAGPSGRRQHGRRVEKGSVVAHVAVALVSGAVAFGLVHGSKEFTARAQRDASPHQRDQERRLRFSNNGASRMKTMRLHRRPELLKRQAASNNLTNGFDPQGPDYESLNEDNVVPLRSFNDNRFIFEEVEEIADGLGPTYNAQSCRECHQNVVTGGASQITEHRTGRLTDGQFFESQGGTLIQSRTIHPDAGELVAFEDDIRDVPHLDEHSGCGVCRSHRQCHVETHP